MNVQPPRDLLTPAPPAVPAEAGAAPTVGAAARSRLGRLVNLLLGKAATMVLAALALGVGIATFVLLAGSPGTCARASVSGWCWPI